MNILKQTQTIFDAAQKELPAKAELEVYLSQGQSRSLSWSEKQCEKISQAEGGGVGLRVILQGGRGGQQGFSFTTDLSSASIVACVQAAVHAAQILPPDPLRRLAQQTPSSADWNENDFKDPDLFSASIPELKDRLRSGEETLLAKYPDLRSILRAGFGQGSGQVALVNSNGTCVTHASSYSSLGVSCLAERNGERQEGGYYSSKIFSKEIDWNFVFDEAARRTVGLLGARAVSSGNVPVVFDPGVACEFFDLITNALNAETVQKGKSLLSKKVGQSVASSLVNFMDDGRLKGGLASAPFDDEGHPTQRTSVIENGILKTFLYDSYTAQKDQVVSTGNAVRSGFKSSPSVGTTNFYLVPGQSRRADVLAQTKGLYLQEVMGLHMADPISGEFSVAAIGSWLEDGVFQHGVRGVTLAGNILEMLNNVDAVCDDLTFFGSTGSPTFRVQNLSLSGEQK